MADAKFTPGPWLTNCSHIYSPDGAIIATVSNPGSKESDYPLVANRNLMAAAPELRASVEETHAWVRRIQDVMTGYLVPDGYDADEALNRLIEMLDGPEQREIQGRAFAALAKAKGNDNGRS